ncbi:conserved unknown protein [Ectocarpus siliculosus]|uniref:Glycosyltransferase 61 catalytic domain-containing protein n=1 Tax=Ectocarpus siliculosus TaxID=2880 RepID=D8LB14_ECTSI|nr:conserved unknown protein [Ectocarpus siliculosus]|eukprot:CBN76523.1 conserved unknown protein [Ectocarpus siliculosus]
MKRRIEPGKDSDIEKDEESRETQRKVKLIPRRSELTPAVWFMLKILVGVGGIAMVVNPVYIWGEAPGGLPSDTDVVYQQAESTFYAPGKREQSAALPDGVTLKPGGGNQQLRRVAHVGEEQDPMPPLSPTGGVNSENLRDVRGTGSHPVGAEVGQLNAPVAGESYEIASAAIETDKAEDPVATDVLPAITKFTGDDRSPGGDSLAEADAGAHAGVALAATADERDNAGTFVVKSVEGRGQAGESQLDKLVDTAPEPNQQQELVGEYPTHQLDAASTVLEPAEQPQVTREQPAFLTPETNGADEHVDIAFSPVTTNSAKLASPETNGVEGSIDTAVAAAEAPSLPVADATTLSAKIGVENTGDEDERVDGRVAGGDAASHVPPATPVLPDTSSPVDLDGARGLDGSNVWAWLQEATSLKSICPSNPCKDGKHMLTDNGDLRNEVSRVRGAVVVTRPELTARPGILTPANGLDFVETLRSYFPIFRSSLFPRHLSVYYPGPDVDMASSFSSDNGYEGVPTLVSLTDVFINSSGYVWNEKNYIVPKSCGSAEFDGSSARWSLPRNAPRHDKVFVITQHWGDAYFHFLSECLPRVTLMLDVLLANSEIKIAVHAPPPTWSDRKHYTSELMALLGIQEERLIFVDTEIHADLAILPESTACETPNTAMVNMLRSALLKGMYPSSAGVPPPVTRPPTLVLVRQKEGGLRNHDQIRKALQTKFPKYDVVESFSDSPALQQLHTFAVASLIVAPHTAGLSAMIVSPLNTPVLEIGPPTCSSGYMHLAVKLQHVYARHLGFSDTMSVDALCDSHYEPNVGEIINLVRKLLEAKNQVDIASTPSGVTTAHGVAVDLSPPGTIADHRLQEVGALESNVVSTPPVIGMNPPQTNVHPEETVGAGDKASRRLAMLPPVEKIADAARNWIHEAMKASTGPGGTGMPFSKPQGDGGKQERQAETEDTEGEENAAQDEYSADYDLFPYYDSWEDDAILWRLSDDGYVMSGRGDHFPRVPYPDNAGERQQEGAMKQEKIVSNNPSADHGEEDFDLMQGDEYTTDDDSVLRRATWPGRTEEGENKGRNVSPLPDNVHTGAESLNPEINGAYAQDEMNVGQQSTDEGVLNRESSIDHVTGYEPRPRGRTTFGSGGHGQPQQPRRKRDVKAEEPDVWDADDDFYLNIARESRNGRKENHGGSGPEEQPQQKGRERDVKAGEDVDPDVWEFDDDFYIHIARQWMHERKENHAPEVPAEEAAEEVHEESWTWNPLSTDVEDDFPYYEDPALYEPNSEVEPEQQAMNVGESIGVAINPETDDADEYSLYAIGDFETTKGEQAVSAGGTYSDETPIVSSSTREAENGQVTSTPDGYSGRLQDDDGHPIFAEWRQERQADADAAGVAVEQETDDWSSSSSTDGDVGLQRAHMLAIIRGWNDRLVEQGGQHKKKAGEQWSSFPNFYPNDPFDQSDESEGYFAWEQRYSIRKQPGGGDASVTNVGEEKDEDDEDFQFDSFADNYQLFAHDQHEVAVGAAAHEVGGGLNDQREYGVEEGTPPLDTDSEYFTHLTEMQHFSEMAQGPRFTGMEHQLHQPSPGSQYRMKSAQVAAEQPGEALEQQENKRWTNLRKTSLVGGVALKLLEALLPRNVLAGLQGDNDDETQETQQDPGNADGANSRIGDGGVGVDIDFGPATPGVVQVARKLRGGSNGRKPTEEK